MKKPQQMQAKPQGSAQKLQKTQQQKMAQAPRTPSSSGKPQQQAKKAASSPASATGSSSSSAVAASSSPSFLSSLRNADSTFAALLGPSVSPHDFFTRYWEKQPLHISRTQDDPEGGRGFYKGLFSKAIFDSHLKANAAEMKYGFNLNICVCSEEGRKIDMNPKAEGETLDDDEEDEEEEEEAEEEAAPTPQSKKQQSKSQSKPQSKAAPAAAAADDEEEEGETMTIAQALKLAAAQRAKLKPSTAAAEEADEEDEEEESGEDEEAAADPMDAEEESEADEEGEDDEEEEEALDGTSVSTVRNYAPVRFDDYARLYSEGCTIQALQPQHYSAPMWRVLSQLEEYFGGLAGANCYITPPNSQGLAPHYDDVEVFVLQLEGSKSWKLYHPTQSLPRSHSGDFSHSEIGQPFRTVDLQRGDLMYLPRGVIHEARTSSAMSSHMTISVYQKTAYVDFLSALFPLALDAAFESRATEAFRRGLPVQYLSYMGSAHAMEREIEEGAPEALGITEEEARARSSRHKPQRSSALLGQSRAQLQQKFRGEIKELVTQLQEHLMDQIDECADVLSADYMMHRLPPAPTDSAASSSAAAASSVPAPKRKGAAAQYPEELGVPPVLPGAAIRFLHPSAVRMVVVPADSDSDEEEDDEEEGTEDQEADRNEGHILLTHSLNNSREHHLDGRFPPHPAAGSIQLPLYFAPAILQLLNAPRATFVAVSALKLEFGGGGDEETLQDEEGNEVDAAQAKRDSQLELANTLWLSKLVQTQMPAATKSAASNGSAAAAATTEKKQNKGIKRKGGEEAVSSSSAAAMSPAQPKKKQQTQAPQQQQQQASNGNGNPKQKQQKLKQQR